MKKLNYRFGFTLVELIVVITIIAILGTIAFISFQGYSAEARDAKRISDINNIKKSLELFILNTGKYPLPDSYWNKTFSGELLWNQGTLGEQMFTNLSRNLQEKPLDPKFATEYIYSVANNRREYEVLGIFESNIIGYNIYNNTFAAGEYTPKIEGTYNQVFLRTSNFIVPSPSIIGAQNGSIDLKYNPEDIKSIVVSGGDNLPNIGNSSIAVSTGLLDLNLLVYTGSISSDSTFQEKEDAMNIIKNFYSGTTLVNNEIYSDILSSQTAVELVVVMNNILSSYDSNYISSTNAFCDVKPGISNATFITGNPVVENQGRQHTVPTIGCYFECNEGYVINGILCELEGSQPSEDSWMTLDSNCDIPDIVIGTQTWAGCNSTLGNGVEWGKKEDLSNGVVTSCYPSYDSINDTNDCIIGDISMLSSSKANTWFSGTNINGDSEIANIWGKLYSGENMSSACPTGWHIPSDEEFFNLEVQLGSTDNSTNGEYSGIVSGDSSDGLGWKNNYTKNINNNVIKALKIPLSGRSTDGLSFGFRGNSIGFWSSTSYLSIYNYFGRLYTWNSSKTNRFMRSSSYFHSVRCIKD